MIRLQASIIVLGSRDLVEYEERRQQREVENVKEQFARFEIGVVKGPTFGRLTENNISSYVDSV